jgi:hypothetical protein
MAHTVAIAFGGLAAVYFVLRFALYLTQDAKEPPAIVNGLPFFGPLIGMISEKSLFYLRLRFVGFCDSLTVETNIKMSTEIHITFLSTLFACLFREYT